MRVVRGAIRRWKENADRQRRVVEHRWKLFFCNPAQWMDLRPTKVNKWTPDFVHRKTEEGLWIENKWNPPWVKAELNPVWMEEKPATATVPQVEKMDAASLNKRLSRHAVAGQDEKAMEIYKQMQREGISPNRFNFMRLLKIFTKMKDLEQGVQLHIQINQNNCESDLYVSSCLVDMYTKCGSIEDGWKVFKKMTKRNVVSWNAMIMGFVKGRRGQKAIELFWQMKEENVEPTPTTFVGVLNACAREQALEQGRLVHEKIIQSGCEQNIFVNNSLIDMYAKCGSIQDARAVFDKMRRKDVMSWNSMIFGHAQCDERQKALQLYRQMQGAQVEPNCVTFVGLLNACAGVSALQQGKRIHEQIIQRGLQLDVFVGSGLVDMYAKCGNVEDAYKVFQSMPRRSVVSWNAMLGGYAMNGLTQEALKHFEVMSKVGIQMNGITFISLLSACSHEGLVDEGLHLLQSMSSVHDVPATVKHLACIVDLLGRVGRLHEAEDIIKSMPLVPDVAVWMGLLRASKVHGNVDFGQGVAKNVWDLEPYTSADFALLSNIYPAGGECENIPTMKRHLETLVKKQPGSTWIEVNGEVHVFTADSSEHPQIRKIRAEMERLLIKMKETGYVPVCDNVNGENVFHWCHHSEKLALTFGLISTPKRNSSVHV